MAKKTKRKVARPKLIPSRVKNLLFAADGAIELEVKVSGKDGIRAYGFAFGGVAVPMSAGKGTFSAPAGKKKKLEWVMIGDPGGTMKVSVTRAGNEIKVREKSTIAPPLGEGYDFFTIEVA